MDEEKWNQLITTGATTAESLEELLEGRLGGYATKEGDGWRVDYIGLLVDLISICKMTDASREGFLAMCEEWWDIVDVSDESSTEGNG